jgi:SPP1 gp7 family putative phage head morphogenesis protein
MTLEIQRAQSNLNKKILESQLNNSGQSSDTREYEMALALALWLEHMNARAVVISTIFDKQIVVPTMSSKLANMRTFRDAVKHVLNQVPLLKDDGMAAAAAIETKVNATVINTVQEMRKKLSTLFNNLLRQLMSEEMPEYLAAKGITKDKWLRGEFIKRARALGITASEGYLNTVLTTNMTSAYNLGIVQHAIENSKYIGGLEYVTARDDRVRPNHEAADGLKAPIDDPIWDGFTPPLGYNCRCVLRPVRIDSFETYYPPGVLNGDAHPDPGFGGRLNAK